MFLLLLLRGTLLSKGRESTWKLGKPEGCEKIKFDRFVEHSQMKIDFFLLLFLFIHKLIQQKLDTCKGQAVKIVALDPN